MTIITLHEAEQREAVRKPLARPTHPTCNGNCNQGRACDCTAAVVDDDKWEATQLKDEVWFWGGIAVALTLLIVFAAVLAGWRP